MDIEEFRKHGYQAIDRICDYYKSLSSDDSKPVVPQIQPGYLRGLLPSGPPEKGEDFQIIADDYQKFILPGLTSWQSPNWFGYFPTASSFAGILGDLYATSTPTPGFNWLTSPAATELEAIVMDWSAQLLGLSVDFLNTTGLGGGCLQTTASDSALVAVVAARARYQRKHPEIKMEDLVIYTTTQTHSLGAKAGLVLGLKALHDDEKAGKYPFVLIATIGTTSSGAMDNLPEIKEIVKSYPMLWVHVDAAWAGTALACPEFRDQCYLNEINEIASSFCMNFHKWGLVNFDCSTLWVRDRNNLTEALDITPPFLRTAQKDAGTAIDYKDWQFALGRKFRSLKLWFVLRNHGIDGFRSHVRHSITMSKIFVDKVSQSQLLTIVTPPSLALTVFRLHPKEWSGQALKEDDLNKLNRQLYDRLLARSHELYLTQTILNGVFCIRFAVGASRTAERHIINAFNVIEAEANSSIREISLN